MSSQDGVPQQQEAAPLSLPRFDRLFEATDSSSKAVIHALRPHVDEQVLSGGSVEPPHRFPVVTQIHDA
jgi:hypothetical protein